jgi:phage terminase large subunit
MMSQLEELKPEHIAKIRQRPEIFLKEFLGVTRLEDYHLKILKAFVDHDKIAIAATHAVGKTWITARIALFFLFLYKNSKVITTAPTGRQVKKLLWGELRAAYRKSKIPLGGRLLQTELTINDEWYAMGFSPQKEAGEGREQTGSSFQGFHSDYILIIFDEATGIPADVWKMAEGLLTSGKVVKFICIGNPTSRNCEFFKCFQAFDWKKVYLSCFDSPNLRANGITNLDQLRAELEVMRSLDDEEKLNRLKSYTQSVTYLLSCRWVIERALAWGIDHPLFQSKALGQFPAEEDNVLIQIAEVENSFSRERRAIPGETRFVGVDVARFGEDSTVFTELIGFAHTRTKKIGKKDTVEVTGELIAWLLEHYKEYPTKIIIDGTGVGGGVIDLLKERQREDFIPRNWEILEVHFGQGIEIPEPLGKLDQSEDERYKQRFANLKALMFQLLADDLKESIALIEDSAYLLQLPSIKYKFDSKGRMIIESKDDYKKRTGLTSPDEADSLALANYGRHGGVKVGIFKRSSDTLTQNSSRHDNIKTQENRIKRRYSY